MSEKPTQLVKRCLTGDQQAILELVARYENQVYGLCFRMLGHRQDAEDVAQETFIRALRSLKNWDSNRDFEPWLLAIAGNRCRTALSVRTRRPSVTTLDEPIPNSESTEMQAAQQLAEEVDVALEALREDHRQAFIMFHQLESSYDEIAEAMERPIGTIKTWIHRARRVIMDHLRRRGHVLEDQHALRHI